MARRKATPPPDIGDIVYLRTDPDKFERLVTTFKVEPSGMVLYELAFGDKKSNHYEFELVRQIETRSKVRGFQPNGSSLHKQGRPPRKTRTKQAPKKTCGT